MRRHSLKTAAPPGASLSTPQIDLPAETKNVGGFLDQREFRGLRRARKLHEIARAQQTLDRPREFQTKNREYANQRSIVTVAGEDTKNSPAHAEKTSNEGSRKVRDIRALGSTARILFESGTLGERVITPMSPRMEYVILHWRGKCKETQNSRGGHRGKGGSDWAPPLTGTRPAA